MPISNPITGAVSAAASSLYGVSPEDLLRVLASLMVNNDGVFIRTTDGGFYRAYELDPPVSPAVEAQITQALQQIMTANNGAFMRSNDGGFILSGSDHG